MSAPLSSLLPNAPPQSSSSFDERVFLEGPRSHSRELRLVFHIAREFIMGFRTLHFVGPGVSVFGSAHFHEGHPYYTLALQMGTRLSQLGFTVMTGGGPGLMEAANRGAKAIGGRSVGCNVLLPNEQQPNAYLDHLNRTTRHSYTPMANGEITGWRRKEPSDKICHFCCLRQVLGARAARKGGGLQKCASVPISCGLI